MSSNPGAAIMDQVLKAGEQESHTGNPASGDAGELALDVGKLGSEAGGASTGIPAGSDLPGGITTAAAKGMQIKAEHDFKGAVQDAQDKVSHDEPSKDPGNADHANNMEQTTAAAPEDSGTGDGGDSAGGDGGE